ncbi:MAG: VWA domain-containing protein [Pseudomonadota bacterium]
MIEFARLWALLLLPLPLAAWYLMPPLISRNAITVPPGIWAVLGKVDGTGGALAALTRGTALRVLGWICAVIALAGPEVATERLLSPTGRDVMVAVDLSASMGEPVGAGEGDEPPPRQIDLVGPFVTDFITARRGDRVGLIAFGSEAFLISPLTFDTSAVAGMLPEVSIGLPGRRTDLGQAIGLTVQVLRGQPKAERALLLVSDGETNAGDLAAIDAAALAAEEKITVHVVGFSSEIAPENAAHMAEIAEFTGGRYFEATNAETLGQISTAVAQVLPSALPDDRDRLRQSWAWLPALIALLAIALVGRSELEVA